GARELEARAVLAQRRERVLVEALEVAREQRVEVGGEPVPEAGKRIVPRDARELAGKLGERRLHERFPPGCRISREAFHHLRERQQSLDREEPAEVLALHLVVALV